MTTKKTQRLSAKDLAIISAGGKLSADAGDTEVELTAEEIAAAEATAQAEADAAAAEAAAAAAAKDNANPEGSGTTITTPELKDQSNVIELLNTQAREKDEKLIAAGVTLATTQAELSALKASQTGLLEIAAASVSNMRVALGLAAVDMSASGAAEMLAEHTKLSAQFTSQYKVGGVAAVMPAEKTEANVVTNDGEHAARMASVGAKLNVKEL